MATSPAAAAVASFLDLADNAIVRGDPRFVRLGPVADAGTHIRARADVAVKGNRNLQVDYGLSELVAEQWLEARAVARGLTPHDITTRRSLEQCPLLPMFLPWVRIGHVPGPLLVEEGSFALFAGPSGTEHHATVWETTDPALVQQACEVYDALWDESTPWHDVTERPALPERTFTVAVRLADGASDREIADELGTSLRTAATEVRRVVDWCGARSRNHAIAVLVGAD